MKNWTVLRGHCDLEIRIPSSLFAPNSLVRLLYFIVEAVKPLRYSYSFAGASEIDAFGRKRVSAKPVKLDAHLSPTVILLFSTFSFSVSRVIVVGVEIPIDFLCTQ